MDLSELSARLEITEALSRYARAVDERDWDLWKSVFTADAEIDYRSAGGPVGSRDDVAAWLRDALGGFPMTQHYVTNVEVVLDGDGAAVTAMFYNPMQFPGATDLSFCGGWYHHEFVRTAEGWKSRRLREENRWFVNGPTAPR